MYNYILCRHIVAALLLLLLLFAYKYISFPQRAMMMIVNVLDVVWMALACKVGEPSNVAEHVLSIDVLLGLPDGRDDANVDDEDDEVEERQREEQTSVPHVGDLIFRAHLVVGARAEHTDERKVEVDVERAHGEPQDGQYIKVLKPLLKSDREDKHRVGDHVGDENDVESSVQLPKHLHLNDKGDNDQVEPCNKIEQREPSVHLCVLHSVSEMLFGEIFCIATT